MVIRARSFSKTNKYCILKKYTFLDVFTFLLTEQGWFHFVDDGIVLFLKRRYNVMRGSSVCVYICVSERLKLFHIS